MRQNASIQAILLQVAAWDSQSGCHENLSADYDAKVGIPLEVDRQESLILLG